jgi:ComF family protein
MRKILNHRIKEFLEGLIDVVYPLNCIICKARLESVESIPLCTVCFRKIKKIEPPFCNKCGKPLEVNLDPENICVDCRSRRYWFDRAWASASYEGILRECIHFLKYNHRMSLVGLLSKILINFADRYMNIEQFDYIMPVPLHRTKLREREFNQSYLLASPFASRFNKILLSKQVYRVKYTLAQSELTSVQRRENIRDAFRIRNSESVRNRDILIIDDVFTTGATVDECASLLKKNGARHIEVLTLAR